MATKWTEEQLQAINTRDCNLLVAAAAGSGKTAVLVERIIKIITDKENPVDIDKLLVVTFTSAAAGEMRERIADAISKELEKEPNSKNLQRQLTLLSKANITTMHSFCLDTIKNNFHHIDLDPAFRISDDTEGTLMKLETLTELFEEKYDQENKEFIILLDAYGSGKDDKKLQELVLNLYEFSMSGPWPENWLKEKSEDFNIYSEEELENTPWIKVLKESVLLELNSLIKNLYIALDLAENSGGLEPYGENLNDDINILNNIKVSLEEGSLKDIHLRISLVKFSTLKRVLAKNVEDPDTQERVKKIRDEVKKSISKMGDGAFNVAPEEILEGLKLLYPLMKSLSNLVIDFKNRYEAKKRERGVLDFNDLEHLCLKILIDEEEGETKPSSVASSLREKFNEVLVDEYQDSNNVQETIINLVSRKELENPNVFMVGDVKQSIYRFRQAKPELFLEKYNSYGTEDTDKNRKIMLYKNFRSREEVINGVNFIFTQLMSTTVGELEYDEKEALNLGASYSYPEEEGVQVAGDIELHIIDKSGEEEKEEYEVTEEIEIDSEEEEDLTAVQIEARIVGSRINNLMNPKDGSIYKVLDKGTGEYRKIRFKDIVILLRATKNWADTFLEELGAMGIPIYADTGSGYFETIEIRTILSVLQVIDNPLQDVPIISTLRSPIFSFTAEELADLRIIGEEDYYFETIEKIALGEKEVNQSLKEKCIYFINNIRRWREKAIYTPIDEFIWYLYMDTSYYGYVGAMSNGIQRQANLRILFQRARQFERTSFKGLFNFINFIHRLRSSSGDMGSAKILGENEDVVRIMSIHKSKGLEFPVVFLSGCGKQFNLMDLNKEVLFHEDLGFGPQVIDVERRVSYPSIAKNAIKKKFLVEALSEEMRILYVALTRAKEKLIITGATTNFDRSVDKWRRSTALGDNKISPSEVLKKRSFLDWIALALCRHKDGGILRGENSFVENLSLDNSHWNINLWRKSQMPVEENFIAVDKNEEKELFINKEYKSINKEIERRLGFKYKYRESSLLPSNISVSDLKKRAYEDLQEEATYDVFKVEKVIKPVFLQEERGLSPAERGTIVHFFMQKLELGKSNSYSDIKEQIEELIARDLLREDESKVINIKKILNFMNSNLGQRMKRAFEEGREVNRELAFYTEISALNFDKTLPREYETERVRLQGVIDAYFEEEDGIILLDYKTDYVGEKGVEEIIDRYRLQLDYYEEALEKITGKKVKERYLYLFNKDKEVKI
ncbi:helicase-exonuclease AddAB subunit AddA [Clostridium sp. YIM B02506]|uniref:helicase-exonuclease AddAB subunit AddA n=1 Tax=Clostridium sp. YIM B02506 TaxID=2910680 RepID=UPI001EEEFFAE|nr:helicase-exonuclease AddAB subunit AddA [Clostridium sp. YIM B02506]